MVGWVFFMYPLIFGVITRNKMYLEQIAIDSIDKGLNAI